MNMSSSFPLNLPKKIWYQTNKTMGQLCLKRLLYQAIQ
jgi:hypothetical protein